MLFGWRALIAPHLYSIGPFACFLFYCHGFRQVPRLIHIQAFRNADIVYHQLQRHDGQAGRKILFCLRDIHREIRIVLNIIIAIQGQPHQVSAPALCLHHIAQRLLKKSLLSDHAYDQSPVLDQTDRAVLEFSRCISL